MRALLFSCLFMVVSIVLAKPVMTSGVLDIAHRGYAAKNQESTLRAFRYAIAQGTDGLELDVRQSADNVLLVTHDPVIAQLGNQRVENTSSKLAFLRSDIPSLEEVIILAKQNKIPLWIEIKQSHLYPGIIQRLLTLLQHYNYQNNVVIQSFNHQDLLVVYQHNPNIPLLALFFSNFQMSKVPAFVELVGLPLLSRYLDQTLVEALHDVGKGVIFWRHNEASENSTVIRKFIAIGADGFILDKPIEEIMQDIQ